MQNPLFLLILLLPLLAGSCKNSENELKVTEYVLPPGGYFPQGSNSVGAARPFGGIQIGPDYAGQDTLIASFSHSYPEVPYENGLRNIRILPVVSCPDTNQLPVAYIRANYSPYNSGQEKTEAGYYGITLENGIETEVTVTNRCGIYYYSYPTNRACALTIDLGTSSPNDTTLETAIRKVNNRTLEGYRKSRGHAGDQRTYFVIEFSQDCRILAGKEKFRTLETGEKFRDDACYIWVDLGRHTNKILTKIGISPANTEGAAANLEKELSHWSFDKVRKDAKQSWKRELMKTHAEGGAEKQLQTFYSALYRIYLSPCLFSDVHGNYKGPDGEIHSTRRGPQYTSFPMQALSRSVYPLLTITQRKRMPDFIHSVLKHAEVCGSLPRYELAGNEISIGNGSPAIPVLTEAYLKGFRNPDPEQAYQMMKKSLPKLSEVQEEHPQPGTVHQQTIPRMYEHAYEYWCMAQMAKALGKEDDYLLFLQTSRKALLPSGQTSGKSINRPGIVSVYDWDVRQDIPGLLRQYEDQIHFQAALDGMFRSGTPVSYDHRIPAGHHLPYLYQYIAQPEKTQYLVDSLRTYFYEKDPFHWRNDENSQQLAAWYVFSALGFYPVNPVESKFELGTPLFKKVMLKVGPEKRFLITANKVNEQYIYVREVRLNEKPLDRNWITYEEIMRGGKLEFVLSDQPVR